MNEMIEEAKRQYASLEAICGRIVESGNWQKVKANDVKLFLNMYVQVLMLSMAQADGVFDEDTLSFIADVPPSDILKLRGASPDQAKLILFKNRSFVQGIPLLLRCCVAHDEKSGTQDSDAFVAGITRILHAQAATVDAMSGKELKFITSYGVQMRNFLSQMERSVPAKPVKEQYATKKAAPKSEQEQTAKAPENEKTLEELRAELDMLIGLDDVKKEVETLINLIRVRKMREQHGLKNMDMSFHMVFTGSPGTGKTTVARLIAGIYRQLGFLSSGQLIETDRAGLVAGFVGQTAEKVTNVVKSALGGILFIDEAYALARKGMTNDFGREAIDTLVKLMEDHRDDLVVIVAGYTQEMHDFLTTNPGLISRFNKYIDFKDYTDDELMDILKMRSDKQGYIVKEDAKKYIKRMLMMMSSDKRADFGNARGMRNVLEKLVQAQSNRLAAHQGEMTVELLQTIDLEDAKVACPVDFDILEELEKMELPSIDTPEPDRLQTKEEDTQTGKDE